PELRVAAPASTLALVYLGVFPTGAAVVTWSYALHHLPASRAAAFLYAVPAATLIIGVVWLGEIPTPLVLCGGALTLTGVAFTAWLSRARAARG
ncbi:MAG: DMT family transporter, partial [Gemmatimonadetes bacterium]|nr:DMT family transporter [Gemmatimonadota bacterium]